MSDRRPEREWVDFGIRSLTGDVAVEIHIKAPADAFRGEMTVAVDRAIGRIRERVDEHYRGGGTM